MGVEVQKPASVHEGRAGLQLPLHQRTGPVGSLLTSLYLLGEPLVERLRDVLQEQREARSGPLKGLDPTAHLRAASPIGHDPLHVGEFLGKRGRVRQHAPVVHQREPLVLPSEHPVRRHGVHGELPPRPETGPATDAVLAVGRNPEQVGRGPRVLRQVPASPPGERHPLHEDRLPVDLQQRGRAADTGAKGQGGVDELAPAGGHCAGRGRWRRHCRRSSVRCPAHRLARSLSASECRPRSPRVRTCLRTVPAHCTRRRAGRASHGSPQTLAAPRLAGIPCLLTEAHRPRAATRRYDRYGTGAQHFAHQRNRELPDAGPAPGRPEARQPQRWQLLGLRSRGRPAESARPEKVRDAVPGPGRTPGSPFQENEDLHPNQCHVVTEGRPERLNAPIRGTRHDQGPDA
ncbi:hypothetical protein SCYAM73S_06562 [Streptomyces cyaneofuscatus]